MSDAMKAKDDIRTALEEMLKSYGRSAGANLSCAIRDLLTEVMHLCDDNLLDFGGRLHAAREIYRQERTERMQSHEQTQRDLPGAGQRARIGRETSHVSEGHRSRSGKKIL